MRLTIGFGTALAIALHPIQLAAATYIPNISQYCGLCWQYFGNQYWLGAIFCAVQGC